MVKSTGLFLLGVGLLLPVVTPVRAQDRDHDRDDRNRYYDNDRRDYHEWNEHENRAWHRYWEMRHRDYVDWRRANEEQRREYWRWRHEHPDSALWPDRR
ncbi:MAG TPA: hypothetical protein VGL72_22490 [Bryobacteraceae bacterium]